MTGIMLESLIAQLLHKSDFDGTALEILNDSLDDDCQFTHSDISVSTQSLTDANSPHSILRVEIGGTRFRIQIEG